MQDIVNHRKINMGMVGGGPGSLIGKVHAMGAMLDGQISLVCGAFSSDPEKSEIRGREYFLPPERIYPAWQEMIQREKDLPDGERMDFLCIATPNHLHYGPARMALENGFHVVCDKPLTHTAEDARKLVSLVEKTGLLFVMTYPYVAYPMVKEARARIDDGQLGKIRKVVVEYPQGWLSAPVEKAGNRQALWRTDPDRSGPGGAMADIGVHAFYLAEYVTGLQVTALMADLNPVVPGRRLDDDGNILLRFSNGAGGVLFATQIAAGEENDVNIRVWGEKGGLEWHHHDPNRLILRIEGEPVRVLRPGHSEYLFHGAMYASRLPAGHPEGYIEAFGNIYRQVAACIRARYRGADPSPEESDLPNIYTGLRGMLFQEAALASSADRQWVTMP